MLRTRDPLALDALSAGAGGPGRLMLRTENRLLLASPSPAVRPVPEGGIVTLRFYRVHPGALDLFHRLTAEQVWTQTAARDAGYHIGL